MSSLNLDNSTSLDKKVRQIPKQFARLNDLLKEFLKMLKTCRTRLHFKIEAHSYFSFFFQYFFLAKAKLSITDDKLSNSTKEATLLVSLNTHTIFGERKIILHN